MCRGYFKVLVVRERFGAHLDINFCLASDLSNFLHRNQDAVSSHLSQPLLKHRTHNVIPMSDPIKVLMCIQ